MSEGMYTRYFKSLGSLRTKFMAWVDKRPPDYKEGEERFNDAMHTVEVRLLQKLHNTVTACEKAFPHHTITADYHCFSAVIKGGGDLTTSITHAVCVCPEFIDWVNKTLPAYKGDNDE